MIKTSAIIISAGLILGGLTAPVNRATQQIAKKNTINECISMRNANPTERVSTKNANPTEIHYEFDKLKSDDYIENPFYYSDSYTLTPEERDLVERTIMHEAGWCPDYRLLILTAQCFRNDCELNGWRPAEVFSKCGYAAMSYVNPRSRKAVSDVFDRKIKCVNEDIFCFYNRNLVSSTLHESQRLAIDIDGNRFFY